MKTCFKCQRQLEVDQFYRHPAMADGRLGKCKECTCRDVRQHRARNIDKVREYDRLRGRTEKRRALNRRVSKDMNAKYPEKRRARVVLGNAVKRGCVKKDDCWCGAKGEAHHPDYSKPLDVIWLCRVHHEELHHGESL